MHISFDTNDLSPADLQFLQAIAGASQLPEPTPAAKPAPPAKKAAPKAEPKPEPVVEEDLLGGEDTPAEPEGPTMADAVAAATKLVSSGGAPKVKEALTAVGAKRVSEIPADKVAEFLAALEA